MKNKLFLKVVALLVLVAMFAVSITSCGNGTATTTTERNPNITPPENSIPSQLEGMKEKTNGTTVSFIFVDGSTGGYTADSIWVDPDSGDLDDVDAGIIERNNSIY